MCILNSVFVFSVKFDTFDVSQWNVENNILVLKYLVSSISQSLSSNIIEMYVMYSNCSALFYSDRFYIFSLTFFSLLGFHLTPHVTCYNRRARV